MARKTKTEIRDRELRRRLVALLDEAREIRELENRCFQTRDAAQMGRLQNRLDELWPEVDAIRAELRRSR